MCASQEAVDLLLAGGRRRLNPTEAVICADRPTQGYKTSLQPEKL